MKTIRKPLLFTLCLLPVALIGGWFTAQYTVANTDGTLLEAALRQVGSKEVLQAIVVVQTVLYAVICGFFGCILSDKIGLMRPFRFRKTETIRTAAAAIVCGAVFSLDAWTFAKWIPELANSYSDTAFDAPTWISAVLYGGVIEEVMLRLFLMSLLAFIAWKLFFRRTGAVPEKTLVVINVLVALVFAAAHLPVTITFFGHLTPMIILRCFLMNGAAGLVFGRLYRKYGIQYAMLSHVLFHLVSKTIWLIA